MRFLFLFGLTCVLLDSIVESESHIQSCVVVGGDMAKKRPNAYFEGIRAGLEEIVDSLETGRKLTRREIRLPEAPAEISGEQIASLRQKKLHMSQHVFASVLNVSLKTVQAWEQGRNVPSGPALRLLWLLTAKPDILEPILAGRATPGQRG